MPKLVSTLLFNTFVFLLYAQPALSPRDSITLVDTLANGLTYYIRPNTLDSQRIELRLLVKVGALHEEESEIGYAHLVEHLAFNGTTKYPKNSLVQFLEANGLRFGADQNATTTLDRTVYQLSIRPNKELLQEGLGILREWAGNVVFDPAEVEQEKGVVAAEFVRQNRAGVNFAQQVREWQYYPLRGRKLLVIDTTRTNHVTAAELKAFYKKWYTPERMAVVVVGNVEQGQVKQQIERLFSDLQKGKEKKYERLSKPATKNDLLIKNITLPASTSTQLLINYTLPTQNIFSEDGLREQRVREIVAQIYTSRLQQRLEQFDIVFNLKRNFNVIWDELNLQLSVPLINRNVTEAFVFDQIKTVQQEIQDMGFTEGAMHKVLGDFYQSRTFLPLDEQRRYTQKEANILLEIAMGYLPQLTNKAVRQYFTDQPIQFSEVNAYAKKAFRANNLKVLRIAGQNGEWTDEKLLTTWQNPQYETPAISATPRKQRSALDIEQLPPVAITKEFPFVLEEVHQGRIFTLENGVQFRVLFHKNGEHLIKAVSRGGASSISPTDYQLLLLGIGLSVIAGDEEKLRKVVTQGRGKLDYQYWVDHLSEGFTTQQFQLDTLLTRTYDFFTQLQLDTVLYRKMTKLYKENAIWREREVFTYQNEQSTKIKHGDNPLFIPYLTVHDSVAVPQRVENLLTTRFAAANDFKFYFSLDTTQISNIDLSIQRIATVLGNLPVGRCDQIHPININFHQDAIQAVIPNRIDEQIYYEYIWHGNLSPTNLSSILTLNLLKDLLHRKLLTAIREGQGATYAIDNNLYLVEQLDGIPKYRLQFRWQTPSVLTDEVTEVVQSILRQVEDPNFIQTDFLAIKKQWQLAIQNNVAYHQQTNQIIQRLINQEYGLFSLENFSIEEQLAALEKITVDDVVKNIKGWLNQERELRIIMRPVEN